MKAIGTFVQVKCVEASKGFVSTETVMREGKVMSIGTEVKTVEAGDTVLFSKESHVLEHPIKGVQYFFVDIKSIIAKSK